MELTLRSLEVISYDITYWLIILIFAGAYFVFNKWAIMIPYFLLGLFSSYLNLLEQGSFGYIVLYAIIYYIFIFLIKENRVNVTTLVFAGLCVFNVLCNVIMAVLFFFISLFNHTGDWFRVGGENDRYYILMIVIIYASFGLTVVFTKWLKPFVLKMKGKLKAGMFIFLPVMFMLNSLTKAGNVTEYKADPSGITLALDFAAGIITCICVIVIVILKIREQKIENEKIERYLDNVKRDYDDMAKTENELRTLKHEIKNQIIEEQK